MKCEFCGLEFSDPVFPHHIERCEQKPEPQKLETEPVITTELKDGEQEIPSKKSGKKK